VARLLEVASDVICPWCFIGKRRLERALREVGELEVSWLPFELNPGMPKAGMARRDYRTGKFGSEAESNRLDRHVAEVGKSEGIHFAFDRIERTPNTFDAHRMICFAGVHGRQDALVEELFRRYFLLGEDVGCAEILLAACEAVGLDGGVVSRLLGSEEFAAEVRRDEEGVRRLGVSGVPSFILDGEVIAVGAQRPEVLVEAIRARR
jgi:predicted DsbA family dithiol-disulfide isomerase